MASLNNAINSSTAPSFMASLGSAVTNVTGDGTVYTPIFTSETYDIGGNYNNANGIFTAPIQGDYLFSYILALNNLGAAHTSGDGIYIFTSDQASFFAHIVNFFAISQAGSLYLGGSSIVRMTAGGTAQMRIMIAGGTKTVGVGDTGATRFSGRLMGVY